MAGERALLLLLRQAGVVPPQWARTVVTLVRISLNIRYHSCL